MLLLLVAATGGCGGGGHSATSFGGPTTPSQPRPTNNAPTNGPIAGRGAVGFSITWPEPSRLIPLAAQSIRVIVTDANNAVVGQTVVARPEDGKNRTTAKLTDIPSGNVVVSASAHPNRDGTGTAQASGSVAVSVQPNQTANTSLTLDLSLIHI